jgi:hypothetical protein
MIPTLIDEAGRIMKAQALAGDRYEKMGKLKDKNPFDDFVNHSVIGVFIPKKQRI